MFKRHCSPSPSIIYQLSPFYCVRFQAHPINFDYWMDWIITKRYKICDIYHLIKGAKHLASKRVGADDNGKGRGDPSPPFRKFKLIKFSSYIYQQQGSPPTPPTHTHTQSSIHNYSSKPNLPTLEKCLVPRMFMYLANEKRNIQFLLSTTDTKLKKKLVMQIKCFSPKFMKL